MKEVKLKLVKEPASFFKRALAYIVDMILINFVVVLPFRAQLEQHTSYSLMLSRTGDSSLTSITIVIVLLSLFYFVVMEYKVGQTFGKMLMNLYVNNGRSKKYKATAGQVFLRNLTKPFPVVLAIDTAYMFFKRGNQRLFEKFSGTDVVGVRWKIK